MKFLSLIAAAALVVVASAFAVVHAAINRSGQPDAEITLTERELNYWAGSDDSGVALNLRWVETSIVPNAPMPPPDQQAGTLLNQALLNQAKLEELGFDCHVDPSDPAADNYYANSRQSARTGFVVLEYDGPAWRTWIERRELNEPRLPEAQKRSVDYDRESGSRLAVVDAGPDPAVLRAHHPDRSRFLVLPAVFRISLSPRTPATTDHPAISARLVGFIQEIPSEIHVPRPFSERFRGQNRTYNVTLRYGRLHEPWVVGVN